MSHFIDWLTIHQNHPEGGLPIVAKELNTVSDPDTDEFIKSFTKKKKIEGSFSSIISVHCDGSKVSVCGNPSRWNRADNLFGFSTIDECVRVYNLVLADFGLPPFTKNIGNSLYHQHDGASMQFIPTGAVISRIDITENLVVGEGNEDAFIRGLSTQSVGKGQKPFLFPNGKTVDWAKGSTLWYLKMYNKAHEIELGLNRKRKKTSEVHKAYLRKLIEYCKLIGIVRNEKEFKTEFLKRHNLNLYGKVNLKDFIPYLNDIENILKRIDMSTSNFINISEQLLTKKVVTTTRASNTTQYVALQWLHGQPYSGGSTQYHVHKARLLKIGIDISIPFDATKIMPQIKNNRVISVSRAVPPSWYDMPKVAHLRVA